MAYCLTWKQLNQAFGAGGTALAGIAVKRSMVNAYQDLRTSPQTPGRIRRSHRGRYGTMTLMSTGCSLVSPSVDTTYTLIVTDDFGRVSTDSVTVRVAP